jgi:putative DNA primase/helicase
MHDITLGDVDLIDYHQRSLGATLSGAIFDHFLLFWLGEGRNGKNTLGDLIAWILGDYAKVIPTETLMSSKSQRHPTELANLRGLRLAISSEVPEGSCWNESRIKSLTGDAMIAARFMGGNFFEFPRTHKHLVFGNHRPILRVVDTAIKARLHVVPFKAQFVGAAADPNMSTKLRAEAPQILHWLVMGHEKWLSDGQLLKCSAVDRETSEYFEAQSTPDMWVRERCIYDSSVKKGDAGWQDRSGKAGVLYCDYSDWKKRRGELPISQTSWGEWMGARYKREKYGVAHYVGLQMIARSTVYPAKDDSE